eukprot:9554979-Alexandrium_andersonii.AAC.1
MWNQALQGAWAATFLGDQEDVDAYLGRGKAVRQSGLSNAPAPYQGEEAVLQAAHNATCRQLLRALRRLDELAVKAKAVVETGARQLTDSAMRLVEA